MSALSLDLQPLCDAMRAFGISMVQATRAMDAFVAAYRRAFPDEEWQNAYVTRFLSRATAGERLKLTAMELAGLTRYEAAMALWDERC